MDRIDLLRTFARIVEARSFTRAAADLGVARSSVSMAMQELEARLGARLLHRSTRQIALTPEGETLYQRSLQLIGDMDEIEGLFTSADRVEGRVRVEMPLRVGRVIVSPALPQLFALHPGLKLDVGTSDRFVDLIAEGVDLALRIGDLSDSGLVSRKIGEMVFINVASPAYLAERGTPAGPQDLARHVEVGFVSPSTGRPLSWQWLDDPGSGAAMQRHVVTNSAEMLVSCALSGMGISRVPAYEVVDHLERGELVQVLPQLRTPPMPVSLISQHRRQTTRRVRVVADWLAGVMGEALKRGLKTEFTS